MSTNCNFLEKRIKVNSQNPDACSKEMNELICEENCEERNIIDNIRLVEFNFKTKESISLFFNEHDSFKLQFLRLFINVMKYSLLLIIFSILIISCNENKSNTSSKDSEGSVAKLAINDPFSKTTVESEFFSISADKDTIIEGKNGIIIQIPKGAFKDAQGNVVTGEVKIELAEPETLDDYLLSGITSQSGDKLLNSKGTFYINALQNGEQLLPNENNLTKVSELLNS